MTKTKQRFGRLTAILTVFAVVGLVAVFVGIQSARTLILTQISTNSAEQWAEILSFSVAEPNLSNGVDFDSPRVG